MFLISWPELIERVWLLNLIGEDASTKCRNRYNFWEIKSERGFWGFFAERGRKPGRPFGVMYVLSFSAMTRPPGRIASRMTAHTGIQPRAAQNPATRHTSDRLVHQIQNSPKNIVSKADRHSQISLLRMFADQHRYFVGWELGRRAVDRCVSQATHRSRVPGNRLESTSIRSTDDDVAAVEHIYVRHFLAGNPLPPPVPFSKSHSIDLDCFIFSPHLINLRWKKGQLITASRRRTLCF